MEIEGLGVSLVGRSMWSYRMRSDDRSAEHGSGIPWEFIQGVNYGMKILVHGKRGGSTRSSRISEMEKDWTCVWSAPSQRDWSCIATLVRSVGAGGCLLVFDHCTGIPATFWSFLDGVQREGRTAITRVWVHTEAPPAWIPDAIFFPPLQMSEAAIALQILQALPPRNGHGPWHPTVEWENVVRATAEQQLGLAISDVEETEWTLMWHRPADSRPPSEQLIPRAIQWIETGTTLLKSLVEE